MSSPNCNLMSSLLLSHRGTNTNQPLGLGVDPAHFIVPGCGALVGITAAAVTASSCRAMQGLPDGHLSLTDAVPVSWRTYAGRFPAKTRRWGNKIIFFSANRATRAVLWAARALPGFAHAWLRAWQLVIIYLMSFSTVIMISLSVINMLNILTYLLN